MKEIYIGNIRLRDKVICVIPLTDDDVFTMDCPIGADMIELRIDMFNDVSINKIIETFNQARIKFNLPIIATIRSIKEGGTGSLTDGQRIDIYSAIIDLTDAVDIEINSSIVKEIIALSKKHKKTSIASFHDFKQTPNLTFLEEIHNKGRENSCDIIKIAVTPNNFNDLRTITEFTLKYWDKGIVTIAMGQLGRSSRLYLPLIGSLFTFATVKTTSAPGQLSLKEMRQFFPD